MPLLVQSSPYFLKQKQTSMGALASCAASSHLKNQTSQVKPQAIQHQRFMTFLYRPSPLSFLLTGSKEPNQAKQEIPVIPLSLLDKLLSCGLEFREDGLLRVSSL